MFCIQKLDILLAMEIKQHAPPLGQFLAVHEALRPFGIVVGDLDCEDVHAGLAGDLKRLLAGRPGRRPQQQEGQRDKTSQRIRRACALAFTRPRSERQPENPAI